MIMPANCATYWPNRPDRSSRPHLATRQQPIPFLNCGRVVRHSPGTVIAHTGWISDSGRRLCEGSWQRLRTSLAQSHSYKYDPTAFEELSV
jgi:hypothetical protein